MGPSSARPWFPIGLAAGLIALAGCSHRPSYRADQIVGAIEQLAAAEYHATMTARLIGQTVAVHLSHPGLISQEGDRIQLSEDAHEMLGNALEIVHRVLLSTDFDCTFYIFVASDPGTPGVGFTIVRSLDDVRRANASVIPPGEFSSRTVLDLTLVDVSGDLAQWVPREITLEQFLTWQLARRIQARLSERLEEEGFLSSDAVRCTGEFRNGEFAFTLNLAAGAAGAPEASTVEAMFHDATTEIARVLSGYRFNAFTAVRLTHPLSGRTLLLPKTNLEIFR